jgi:hypothetical protein
MSLSGPKLPASSQGSEMRRISRGCIPRPAVILCARLLGESHAVDEVAPVVGTWPCMRFPIGCPYLYLRGFRGMKAAGAKSSEEELPQRHKCASSNRTRYAIITCTNHVV